MPFMPFDYCIERWQHSISHITPDTSQQDTCGYGRSGLSALVENLITYYLMVTYLSKCCGCSVGFMGMP